jgi:hypothetical protein
LPDAVPTTLDAPSADRPVLPFDAGPDAPAGCPAGTVSFAGQCASFLGAYEVNDPGCTMCSAANPYGGGCGCIPGVDGAQMLRVITDCPGAGIEHGSVIGLCQTPTYAPTSDWAGAYQLDDPVDCNRGCRSPNLYTGACSCPLGTTAIALRTLVDASCSDGHVAVLGSQIVFCLPPGAASATFGGAYQQDDTQACRTANPKTGSCSCPAGLSASSLRTVIDGPFGAHVFVCGR